MEYTILLTILFGSVLSQVLPYFRKLSEGKINSFDWNYAYNLVVSSIWSSLLALPVYTTWTIPEGVGDAVAMLMYFDSYHHRNFLLELSAHCTIYPRIYLSRTFLRLLIMLLLRGLLRQAVELSN